MVVRSRRTVPGVACGVFRESGDPKAVSGHGVSLSMDVDRPPRFRGVGDPVSN
jgi:hypothetical protein